MTAFHARWKPLYMVAARYGINGAALDENPPYVVTWMLAPNDDEDDEDRVETPDDIAAVAMARGVA